MHTLKIAHCDIKMENIVVSDENEDKITLVDFGFSNKFD